MRKILLALLLCPITGISQEQIRIDSIIWQKGQTTYVCGTELKNGAKYYFPLNGKGIGRKPNYIGLIVTKRHNIKKRRNRNEFIFTINQ